MERISSRRRQWLRSCKSFVVFFICWEKFGLESYAYLIDLHSHVVLQDLINESGTRTCFENPRVSVQQFSSAGWNPADQVAFMDQHGIRTSVVSCLRCELNDTSPSSILEERLLARRINELLYRELVLKYPGRFQFWASLTLPDVEGAIAEAIYALDTLKAAGIVLSANSYGVYLGDPSFDPLFEVLNNYSAVVFIHFFNLPGSSKYGLPNVPYEAMDAVMDTARAALNLIITNTTRKYPQVSFVLAHAGGFWPFIAYRVAYLLGYESLFFTISDEDILSELGKFYYDLTLSTSQSALPSILSFVQQDRVTYGSDYPHCPTRVVEKFREAYLKFPMSVSQRNGIDFANAEALLNLQMVDRDDEYLPTSTAFTSTRRDHSWRPDAET
ncbi:hypothetical protein Mapa_001027 [Marchantia paleacea]|nr:hypothetical protein Mapa_001027 [Marchantia paleacea]